jgi:2-polyprenyl-3-methyl-5-hydroxy-6-metoxy-1,4-benzoquinol methylase
MATYNATPAAGSTQPTESATNTDTSPFEAYDEKVAAADLNRYRKNGPRPWARALIEAIEAEGVDGATLLDIGGGIGVIQHELLDSGAARATSVEASSAYLSAARSESDRRGLTDRVMYHHGDFVDLAESIQPADVVTLDRVLNVYPDWERLASLSAEHARLLYGVVIPRDTRFVRLVIFAINLVQRLRRQRVRAAIVPIDELERILRQGGLSRRFSATVGPAWQVVLYRRD